MASCSFREGRILDTMKFGLQCLASRGSFAAASDLTSASESPSKVMYIGRIDWSTFDFGRFDPI